MSQVSEGDLRQAQPSVNRSKDIKAQLQKTIEERVSDGGKPVAVKNFRVQNRMMDDCEHTNSFHTSCCCVFCINWILSINVKFRCLICLFRIVCCTGVLVCGQMLCAVWAMTVPANSLQSTSLCVGWFH